MAKAAPAVKAAPFPAKAMPKGPAKGAAKAPPPFTKKAAAKKAVPAKKK